MTTDMEAMRKPRGIIATVRAEEAVRRKLRVGRLRRRRSMGVVAIVTGMRCGPCSGLWTKTVSFTERVSWEGAESVSH